MKEVDVDVEYCGFCDFSRQCNELSEFVKQIHPDVKVNCHKGRQGSFEVKINDVLIYSKLQIAAFPEYQSIADNIQNAKDKKPFTIPKQQPIKDCTIM